MRPSRREAPMYDTIRILGFDVPLIALVLDITGLVMVIAAFVTAGYFVHKSQMIKKAAGSVKDRLEKEAMAGALADRKGSGGGRARMLMKKPRQTFIYSGLGRMFPKLSFEALVLFSIVAVCLCYGLGAVLTGDLFVSFLSAAGCAIGIVGVQAVLAYGNYRSTDAHLVSFLNQLSNFSQFGSAEITDVFLQVAKYMPNPIRYALEECYAEAQVSGNTVASLEACADKLEHPKFKEIIRNIESCLKYTADYKIIVDSMRAGILDERRSAQERKSMASSSAVQMAIVSIMCVVIMVIAERGLDMPIMDMIVNTGVGRFTMIVTGVSYIVFLWTMMKADR